VVPNVARFWSSMPDAVVTSVKVPLREQRELSGAVVEVDLASVGLGRGRGVTDRVLGPRTAEDVGVAVAIDVAQDREMCRPKLVGRAVGGCGEAALEGAIDEHATAAGARLVHQEERPAVTVAQRLARGRRAGLRRATLVEVVHQEVGIAVAVEISRGDAAASHCGEAPRIRSVGK
jgi:hypothetical protein